MNCSLNTRVEKPICLLRIFLNAKEVGKKENREMNFMVKCLSILYVEDINFKFVFLFHPSCKRIRFVWVSVAENILHFFL